MRISRFLLCFFNCKFSSFQSDSQSSNPFSRFFNSENANSPIFFLSESNLNFTRDLRFRSFSQNMHPESNSQKFHQINTCHRVAPMQMFHSNISFRFSFSPCFSLPSHSTWHLEKNQQLEFSLPIYDPSLSSPYSYSPSLFSISLSFHSPFKVLFSFRSHYLFSIGLSAIFSFSGSLPRPFTLDSQRTRLFLPLCHLALSIRIFFFYGAFTLFVFLARLPASFSPILDFFRSNQFDAFRQILQPELLQKGSFQRVTNAILLESHHLRLSFLPLHSQLLRESTFLSFPPVIKMLQFAGYPGKMEGGLMILNNINF